MAKPAFRGSDQATWNFRAARAGECANHPFALVAPIEGESAFLLRQWSVESRRQERLGPNLTGSLKLRDWEVRHFRAGSVLRMLTGTICAPKRGECDGAIRCAQINSDDVCRFAHKRCNGVLLSKGVASGELGIDELGS